jgi:hypothetical protein
MNRIAPYAKAVVALITAVVAAIIVALVALPEGAGLGDIDTLGWFVIAAAVLVEAGLVFGIPNKPNV